MLFQPEHITKIILDQKTQTRRSYYPETDMWEFKKENTRAVLAVDRGQGTSRTRFEVGRVEPIMPGRGRFLAVYKLFGDEPRWCELDAAFQDVATRGDLIWARAELRRDRAMVVQAVRDAGYTPLHMQTLAIRFDEDVVAITDADAVAEGVSPNADDPGAEYLRIIYKINHPALIKRLDKLPQRDWRDFLRETVPLVERQFWVIDFKRYVVTTD